MEHVGRLVEPAAQAMAAEVPHDGAAFALHIGLDGGADVAEGGAGADLRDAAHQRLMGHVDQAFGASHGLAGDEHARGVAVPAIEDHRDVDVQDVAVLELLGPGNAVADDVSDREARRLGVAAIAQRRRHRAVAAHVGVDEVVQRFGRHAGGDMLADAVEDLRREAPRRAHAGEILIAIQLDALRGGLRSGAVHVASPEPERSD